MRWINSDTVLFHIESPYLLNCMRNAFLQSQPCICPLVLEAMVTFPTGRVLCRRCHSRQLSYLHWLQSKGGELTAPLVNPCWLQLQADHSGATFRMNPFFIFENLGRGSRVPELDVRCAFLRNREVKLSFAKFTHFGLVSRCAVVAGIVKFHTSITSQLLALSVYSWQLASK